MGTISGAFREWPAVRNEFRRYVAAVQSLPVEAGPTGEQPSVEEQVYALFNDYPNLEAIFKGTISGNFREWPKVGKELRKFAFEIVEHPRMKSQREREIEKAIGGSVDP